MIDSKFKFIYHDIGQEMFHTGKLDGFNFVFDCGKLGKQKILKERIKEYKQNVLGKDYIDVLVISHFDYDHISGLDELFNDNIKIHTVVLPYLSIEDKFIISLYNEKASREYYNLLVDPINYFRSKEVGNIIIIYSKEKDEPELTKLINNKSLKVYSDKQVYLALENGFSNFIIKVYGLRNKIN